MKATMQTVMERLDDIKSELDYIKKHMVDADTLLTPEEEQRLEESLRNLKEGRTVSLETLEQERKNASH